jgi:DNA repair protein RadC
MPGVGRRGTARGQVAAARGSRRGGRGGLDRDEGISLAARARGAPAPRSDVPLAGRGGPAGAIRDWPPADRPRERLLRLGPSALGDAELLAVLLRTGRPGESALDLARRVLGLTGDDGLAGLAACAPEDLGAISGMGQAKSAALIAALELGRRAGRTPPGPRLVNSAEEAAREMADMATLDREQFRVLLLNTRHLLLASEVVGVGGLDQVAVHPREVFKPAIRRSAAAVILGHNHPSGDPEPSRADVLLTERLVEAGRVLGVAVLDHVIVARRGFVSLRALRLAGFDD